MYLAIGGAVPGTKFVGLSWDRECGFCRFAPFLRYVQMGGVWNRPHCPHCMGSGKMHPHQLTGATAEIVTPAAVVVPDEVVEAMAEAAHEAWMAWYIERGFTSRKAECGEEFMVPFERLTEAGKELDRVIMRSILESLTEHEFTLNGPQRSVGRGTVRLAREIAGAYEISLSDFEEWEPRPWAGPPVGRGEMVSMTEAP